MSDEERLDLTLQWLKGHGEIDLTDEEWGIVRQVVMDEMRSTRETDAHKPDTR